jgi:hypothetical protein
MVPGHPFNEMKPNSGGAAAELDRFAAKKNCKRLPYAREIGSEFLT